MADPKFQPEQRVRLTDAWVDEEGCGLRVGMTGYVDTCDREDGAALVSWDDWQQGHGIALNEWYVETAYLELIP